MPNIKSAMKRDEKSKLENARNKAQKCYEEVRRGGCGGQQGGGCRYL